MRVKFTETRFSCPFLGMIARGHSALIFARRLAVSPTHRTQRHCVGRSAWIRFRQCVGDARAG
jgi:hypothetical protein